MKRTGQIVAIFLLVLVVAVAGLAKLTNPAMFHEQFARFGLAEWFVLVTGSIELIAAGLVASFNDRLRRTGAAMLATTMAAATSLHVIYDPLAMAVPAALLLLLAGYVAIVPLAAGAKAGSADV